MWQDGSRFLVPSGVKWGTGPKVYKGSSKDTPWNHDLLWRLYVEGEAGKLGFRLPEGPDDIDNMPPFMRALACAINPESKALPLYDPYQGDYFKTKANRINSARENFGMTSIAGSRAPDYKRERAEIDVEKQYLATLGFGGAAEDGEKGAPFAGSASGSAAGGGPGSARLSASGSLPNLGLSGGMSNRGGKGTSGSGSHARLPSVRGAGAGAGGASSGRLTERLKVMQAAIDSERRRRTDLERSLDEERAVRSKMQEEVGTFKASLSRSLASQKMTSEKLKKYEQIVEDLAKKMGSRASARKSARK